MKKLLLTALLLTGCQTAAPPAAPPKTEDLVEIGKKIYMDTPHMASAFVPHSKLTCNNCHADLPLVWRYVREVGSRHDEVRPMIGLLERVIGDIDITRPRGG